MFRCLVLFIALPLMAPAATKQNILMVNSNHHGYAWTDDITESLISILDLEKVNLYIEYLDSKRFPDSLHYGWFYQYLNAKYGQTSFPIIITTDNDALDFVLAYNLHNRWGASIIFCGILNHYDYDLDANRMYGVLEPDDYTPLLETILKIHPKKPEYFYLIVENNVTGQIRKNLLSNLLSRHPGTSLKFIEHYHKHELPAIIGQITGESVIFYPGIGNDYHGNTVNPEKFGLAMVRASRVPFYTNYSDLIDSGAVGGYPGYGELQGKKVAFLLSRLLTGEVIPPEERVLATNRELVFNYKMAKKWRLDIEQIPENARFLHKTLPVFKAYPHEALLALSVLLVLGISLGLMILNVIRRRKAENHIRENEQKFKEIAEMLPETVFECDLLGDLQFMNNFGKETFGFQPKGVLPSTSIFELISQKEHPVLRELIEKLKNGAEPAGITLTAIRKDGTSFPFEIRSKLIIKENTPVGIRGIGINITKQKRFERELINAKKKAEESDRLKSAFLANMSHEIRTPLNSIVGFSYLMSERTLNEEETKRMSRFIKNSSDHLLVLINDIIDISKIEAGQIDLTIKESNLKELLNEIELYLEREKERTDKKDINTTVRNELSNKELIIKTDIFRLKQILLNLVSNAIKFTEEGKIEVGCQVINEKVRFYVSDTGVGISNDFKDKVFQRFSKAGPINGKIYPGFGLGLAISKQLVQLLKGTIWCEPNKPKGSTFYVSIPAER